MNKKVPLGVTIALMIIAVSVAVTISQIVSLSYYNNDYTDVEALKEAYSKLNEIDAIVSENYVNETDSSKIADGMAMGYIAALDDRWGAYMTADEYKATLQSMMGKSIGIGINVYQDVDTGYIYVSYVMENTPAASSGLQKGDLICKVGGTDVNEMGYSEAVNAIRGKSGETAVFTVKRGAGDIESVNYAIDLVENGEILGIFPEGKRSRDYTPQNAKAGIALIAHAAKADILPVGIYAKGRIKPFKLTTVRYGKLIKYDELGMSEAGGRSEYKAASVKIMDEIKRLWGMGHEKNTDS